MLKSFIPGHLSYTNFATHLRSNPVHQLIYQVSTTRNASNSRIAHIFPNYKDNARSFLLYLSICYSGKVFVRH